MKKIIGLFAAAALAFGAVSCANDDGISTLSDAVSNTSAIQSELNVTSNNYGGLDDNAFVDSDDNSLDFDDTGTVAASGFDVSAGTYSVTDGVLSIKLQGTTDEKIDDTTTVTITQTQLYTGTVAYDGEGEPTSITLTGLKNFFETNSTDYPASDYISELDKDNASSYETVTRISGSKYELLRYETTVSQTLTLDPDKTPKTVISYLTNLSAGSSTDASKDGFLSANYKNKNTTAALASAADLTAKLAYDVDTSETDVKLSGGGTKQGTPNYLQVSTASSDGSGKAPWDMYIVKIPVTAGEKDIIISDISGYFGSGKSIEYAKVYNGDITAPTETDGSYKGTLVFDSTAAEATGVTVVATGMRCVTLTKSPLNVEVPAGTTITLNILCGKTSTAPSNKLKVNLSTIKLTVKDATYTAE